MAYGVTSEGFVGKSQEVIREELNTAAKSSYGSSVGVTDDDFLGRLLAICAEREALIWEQMELVYHALDPDANSGEAQDSVCAISGVIREAAAPSTVTLTLTGTASTSVAANSQASLSTTLERFETLAVATLVAVTAWAGATGYVVGDRVTNSGNVYQCTTAGTSAGSGGPTGEDYDTLETDNTAVWRFVGEGTAAVDAAAQSVNTGPIVAAAGDIDTIETTVSGWTGVRNLLDATLGTDEETAEALRLRREDELATPGTTPRDALRADLLQVNGVTTVKLFINENDTTDADGVPPHATEALIQGGTDQDIWNRLLASKSAGAKTYGTETGTATDSEGNALPMAFSRPTEIDIYCELTLTYDATTYPTDGDDQIKAAIVAFGDAQSTGKDVTSSGVSAQAFGVTGVLDVSLAYINTASPAVAETTIAIGTRELAVFDTSRIVINSSAATP